MRLLAFLLLIAFPNIAAAADVAGSVASSVVAQFQGVLLSVMHDADSLGFQGRFNRLKPAVKQSHDLARVAHLTLGKYWRSLSRDQKIHFVATFSRLVIATYAHQFHAYSGESFHRKTTRSLHRGRILVQTELIKSNGKRVHLDYILHQRKSHWLIINIIANGVSDLALKRAEYSNIMNRNGFNHLVSLLEGKIVQYNE